MSMIKILLKCLKFLSKNFGIRTYKVKILLFWFTLLFDPKSMFL